MEAQGNYIVKMIDKVLREDIKSISVKQATEAAFCDYTDAWMLRSVCRSLFRVGTIQLYIIPSGSSGCRSWYKVNQSVH
jgi:hypothetical protein